MSYKNLAKLINQANKKKTPEQEFLHILNEATVRLDEDRQPSQTYKPSSLGGCMRTMYFQVIAAPIDTNTGGKNAGFIGICQSGTDRHERIQQTVMDMKGLGYNVEWVDVGEYLRSRSYLGTIVRSQVGNEYKLFNKVLNMSFMCDGVIKFQNKYHILEIKTEASFKFQGRTQPADPHTYQGTAYSVGLGIDLLMFIYEDRNLLGRKVFVHEVTEEEKDTKVVHRIETCNTFVEDHYAWEEGNKTSPHPEIPAMTTVKNGCTYCNFKEECKRW